MKGLSIVLGAVVLCGLLHGSNAIYRFHMALPDTCDLSVNITMTGASMLTKKLILDQRMHGTFLYSANIQLFDNGQKFVTYQLRRPDYAEPGMVSREFISNQGSCHEQDIHSPPKNPFTDVWFVNKVRAEYHGIQCSAMYNDTKMMYFVDEEAGKLYGMVANDQDISIDIRAAKDNTLQTFTYNKEKQYACETRTYIPPTKAAYDAACKKRSALPNLLAQVLRFDAAL